MKRFDLVADVASPSPSLFVEAATAVVGPMWAGMPATDA